MRGNLFVHPAGGIVSHRVDSAAADQDNEIYEAANGEEHADGPEAEHDDEDERRT